MVEDILERVICLCIFWRKMGPDGGRWDRIFDFLIDVKMVEGFGIWIGSLVGTFPFGSVEFVRAYLVPSRGAVRCTWN